MLEDIEVEIRALVDTEAALSKLYQAREEVGVQVVRQNRFLVDYSTFLEGIAERKLDIRIRVTNGVREIIVKEGSFGAGSRRESSVVVGSTTQELMTTMAPMGFRKGVAAVRAIERFSLDGVEFAVQEVRRYDNPDITFRRFVEAEILTDVAGRDAALKKVRSVLATYGLKEITDQEWYEYIAFLNQEANGIFDFSEPNWELVERLGL